MPDISYKNIKKILEENGCKFVRQAKGSHELWFSSKSGNYFVVSKTIKAIGTYKAILKQAGIEGK